MKVYVPKTIYEQLKNYRWPTTTIYPVIDQYSLCCCSDEAALQLEGLGDSLAEKESKDNKVKELEAERKELSSKMNKVDKELSELSGVGDSYYKTCAVSEGEVDKEFRVGDKVYCSRIKRPGEVVSIDKDVLYHYPIEVKYTKFHYHDDEFGLYTREGQYTTKDKPSLKKI